MRPTYYYVFDYRHGLQERLNSTGALPDYILFPFHFTFYSVFEVASYFYPK